MAPKRPGLWLPPSGSAAAAVGSKAPSPPPVVQTITAKTNAAAAKPMSEAMSLMAEMKFKQEKRDLRARLKKELDELTASGVNDLLRIATLRGQLASVESFLAQTDGVQSLSQQAAAPPCPLDDSDSTNLYVGSLAPEWTEEMLMREFGRFGDVTSIKIMYPRTELQRLRGMNCGFVQFRTRKQAEGAKARLNGKECFGMCLRIDWGKAVQPTSWGNRPSLQPHLQPHVEGPPVPVAPKGVPAATQPPQPERKSRWNKAKTIVVSIPEDKVVKRLVDKTAEFIALEGWDFEKQLLDREYENPRFAFLKCETPEELDDPLHVYYRWRVFSYAQGDSEEQWRTEPFQVYDNGPLWQPPTCNRKERVVEEEGRALVIPHFDVVRQLGLGGTSKRRSSGGVGSLDLTPEEQVKLEELITGLTLSRSSVLAAMVFCLDASAASQQISQRICTSITEAQPGLTTAQLSARLFLLSDVLYNSHCTRPGASMYRRQFQEFLPEIFERLGEVCVGISTIAAAALRERVARLSRAWQEWSTFPPQFVKGLEATVHSRSDRPDAADAEGSGVEISAEGKSTALQLRLQQWRSMTNIPALERACRLRGLATKGGQPELVERLCRFEAYWYSQEPEPLPAAVAAAAAAAAQWQQLLDEVVDPELDGEALDEEELKAIAAAGLEEAELEAQEAKEQSKSPDLLLCDLDPQTLIRSGDTTIIEMTVATDSTASSAEAADGPSAPKVEAEREKEKEKEKPKEKVKEKDKERGKDKKTEKEQAFEQEGGDGGEDVEGQRQQARLRQAEKEVLAFQQSLEDAGERPDLVVMKCDRKRMQLLEAAARRDAMLGAVKARGSGERPKPQEGSKQLQANSSSPAAGTGTVEEKATEEKPKKAAGKEPDKTEKSGRAEKAKKDTEKTEKAEKAERIDKDKAEKQENKSKKKRSRSHSRAAAPTKRKRSRSKSVARGRRKDDDRSSTKAGSSSAKERAGNRSRSRSHSGSRSRDRDRDRKGRRSRSHSRPRRRR